MFEPAIVVSSIGVLVASIGGGLALYNARKATLWKRAELANGQVRELYANEELLFACRCLDWNAGRLVVPRSLRPLLADGTETIDHDQTAFRKSLRVDLTTEEAAEDMRLQIYRTALDTLLTWMAATDSAIERRLYKAEDIEDAGYYLGQACRIDEVLRFIDAFGYRKSIGRLARKYAVELPSL
ncbi:hypothetical protein [Rhizobium sp. Rhizsp42]|uniref:hypothetical protein n=1 Tax=Rhizobium sp. Rhizsp42 TaxID=3243034 RepID=UPI0039B11831